MSRILVVDDELTNRFILKKMLEDYQTLVINNGINIEKHIDEFKPDLILLDVMMPERDGFEVAKDLSEEADYSKIPIIFVTAKDAPEDLKEGLNIEGSYDYIVKPIEEITLKARINAVLKQKARENQLYEDTITDSLTQIYNRKYFFARLEEQKEYLVRNSGNFSIAMIDIDFFKNLNDTYGHYAGDIVLKKFADKIKDTIRPYDLAARYGGEEFVILFPDCNINKAENVMERLRKTVEELIINIEEKEIKFTFSCGITDYRENKSENVKEIIEVADKRLYKAKRNGRNQIIIK